MNVWYMYIIQLEQAIGIGPFGFYQLLNDQDLCKLKTYFTVDKMNKLPTVVLPMIKI